MALDTAPLPPSLSTRVPSLNRGDIDNVRRILRFLTLSGTIDAIAAESVTRMMSIVDEDGNPVFEDASPTSPHIVLAEQNAWTTSLGIYYASNAPLLIEDYLLGLSGESPAAAQPEWSWLVHELSEPLDGDVVIPTGRRFKNAIGEEFETAYPLVITSGFLGNEVDADGVFVYQQLAKAVNAGLRSRSAAESITTPSSPVAFVKRTTNPQPSFGGRDAETFEEYRVRAFQEPLDNLMISPIDYQWAVYRYLGPGSRSTILSPGDYPNEVKVCAIAPDGVPLEADHAGLTTYLRERDPNSEPRVVAPPFVTVNVAMEVVLEAFSDLSDAEVQERVTLEVQTLLSPINWGDWGETDNQFSPSRLASQIDQRVPGIDRVTVTAPVASVALEPRIGLPRLGTLAITVTRERR